MPFIEMGGACSSSIMLLIHYFNKYLLSTFYTLDQTLGSKVLGS